MKTTPNDNIVEVHGVKKWYPVQTGFVENLLTRKKQHVRAVDGIDLNVRRGEVFGLAGESGSGKTTTGRLILGLTKPTEGQILYDGVDIASLRAKEIRHLRRRMQMIFQDPTASLNPRMSIGEGIGHPLEIHGIARGKTKKEMVVRMMERVGLTPASVLYDKFPHQLSGGQKQRAVIARALILSPNLVIADEPIAMADVSVRVLLLDLMMDLKDEFNLTYLFVTHDLATAKYICDRIAIMYLGKIVELGTLEQVYTNPRHPYTQALLAAVPVPDPKARRTYPIPKGEIPDPLEPPSGCRFHPRCPECGERCRIEEPPLVEVEAGHLVACHP